MGKKQSIESFHADLSALNLICLDDPLVSQRIRATSTEMRQMMMNALGCPHLLNDVQPYHEKFEVRIKPLTELLEMLDEHMDEERNRQKELCSLEWVLLGRKINELRSQNLSALDFGDMEKNYEKYMLVEFVEDAENAQIQQCEMHNDVIENALELQYATDSIDLNEPQAVLNEFTDALGRYTEEMVADRKDHWENEEDNRMLAMRAGLSEYFADAAGVSAEDKAICQNAIDAVDHQLKTVLNTKQNAKKIETQNRKIQSDLIRIVNSMGGLEEHLDVVTQNILIEKSKRYVQ